jgi:hypothetical protein
VHGGTLQFIGRYRVLGPVAAVAEFHRQSYFCGYLYYGGDGQELNLTYTSGLVYWLLRAFLSFPMTV